MNAVERVKLICKERNISISKLEKACGFGNAYIANLKNGRFPYDRLVTIAKFLNVSPDYIADGEEKTAAQALMKQRSIRHNPTSRVYLFSGIMRCTCCDHAMVGFSLPKPNGDDYYYRCSYGMIYRRCEHTHSIREERLERWLLENVALELDQWQAQYKMTPKKKTPDNAKIKRKIERLKTLYLDELITLEQYKADRAELEAQLVNDADPPDLSELKKQFEGDFQSVYKSLTRKQRQSFWHSVIERIDLDAENNPHIVFRTGI